MNAFEVWAEIGLDTSDFESGMAEAEGTLESFDGSFKGLGSTASNVLSAIGEAAAAALQKAAEVSAQIVTQSVEAYSSYEQLTGGIETLYGEGSDIVMKNAEAAFETAGLSMNDYMDTAMSFAGSLRQSLNGDTQAMAEYTDIAVRDMSDNANKMGTSMTAIQYAYQGFAKGNYTMLDNLKLGYGGTQSEMERLIKDAAALDSAFQPIYDDDGNLEMGMADIIKAINIIQQEMGITGTTAAEAEETIEGSKNSMAAAWENLLTVTASGDPTALQESLDSFIDSFATYAENFVPRIVNAIGGTGAVLQGIVDAITQLPDGYTIDLTSSVLDLATDVFKAGEDLAEWIIDSVTNVLGNTQITHEKMTELGEAIGHFIGNTVENAVKNLPTIISGLFDAGVTLAGSIIDGLVAGLFGADGIDAVGEEMNDSIQEANENAIKADSIVTYMENLVDLYGDAAYDSNEWALAVEKLEEVLPGSKDTIASYTGGIDELVASLRGAIDETKQLAIEQAKAKALEDARAVVADDAAKLGTAQVNRAIFDEATAGYRQDAIALATEMGVTDVNGVSVEDAEIYSLLNLIKGKASHTYGGAQILKREEEIRSGVDAMSQYYVSDESIASLQAQLDEDYAKLGVLEAAIEAIYADTEEGAENAQESEESENGMVGGATLPELWQPEVSGVEAGTPIPGDTSGAIDYDRMISGIQSAMGNTNLNITLTMDGRVIDQILGEKILRYY